MFFRALTLCAFVALCGCNGGRTGGTEGTGTGTGTGTATGSATGSGTGTGTGTATGTATGTGTGTGGFSCADGPSETGPWDFEVGTGVFVTHPIAAAGATVTYDPYAFDANVGALLAAVAGTTSPTPVDITVTGAIVTSKGYVPNSNDGTVSFIFEDANGAMTAFYLDTRAHGVEPTDIAPGDEITFHATSAQEYFGTPELLEVDSFSVTSSGNPVHVVDVMTAGTAITSDLLLYNVETWGEIVAGPTDCNSDCWDYEYAGHTITFRTGTGFESIGECIHWIGPVSDFNGLQLDADDYDWYRWF